MNPVKLTEAIALTLNDPERVIPLLPRQGRCEVPSGSVTCGEQARWWYRNQLRCDDHKPDLRALHAETQAFIKAGDVEGLAEAMRRDADGVADRLAARNR